MEATGLAIPLLPGKTEQDRAVMISCWRGERREEFAASRKRHGITREAVFVQATPDGDVVVLYLEAHDIDAAVNSLATSEDPFDQWFRDHVLEVHGLSLSDGFPPPEQIMDYRAD